MKKVESNISKNFKQKSMLRGYAPGGAVNGPVKNKDSVPAMLTPGEYVLPVQSAQAMGGKEVLDKFVKSTNDGKSPLHMQLGGELPRYFRDAEGNLTPRDGKIYVDSRGGARGLPPPQRALPNPGPRAATNFYVNPEGGASQTLNSTSRAVAPRVQTVNQTVSPEQIARTRAAPGAPLAPPDNSGKAFKFGKFLARRATPLALAGEGVFDAVTNGPSAYNALKTGVGVAGFANPHARALGAGILGGELAAQGVGALAQSNEQPVLSPGFAQEVEGAGGTQAYLRGLQSQRQGISPDEVRQVASRIPDRGSIASSQPTQTAAAVDAGGRGMRSDDLRQLRDSALRRYVDSLELNKSFSHPIARLAQGFGKRNALNTINKLLESESTVQGREDTAKNARGTLKLNQQKLIRDAQNKNFKAYKEATDVNFTPDNKPDHKANQALRNQIAKLMPDFDPRVHDVSTITRFIDDARVSGRLTGNRNRSTAGSLFGFSPPASESALTFNSPQGAELGDLTRGLSPLDYGASKLFGSQVVRDSGGGTSPLSALIGNRSEPGAAENEAQLLRDRKRRSTLEDFISNLGN